MDYKYLADLIFPNIDKTIEDYRKLYPVRNLKEGAKVTRFAPSPTGFVHLGGLYQAIMDQLLAKSSEGVFFLINEDTDKEREYVSSVPNGESFRYLSLALFNRQPRWL